MSNVASTWAARSAAAVFLGVAIAGMAGLAYAERAAEIEREAREAMARLYASNATAKTLGEEAKGILVFPQVGKAGFIFTGEFGVGVLHKNRQPAGYYNIAEVSAGYQAGVEKFSYTLFFMTDAALAYLDKSGGFQLGAGPTLTVVDSGFQKNLTTTTTRSDVYAFAFGAEGLMGGMGLKGSKITRYHPQ
jgi:lipid-binding SYLF domain-containing protein